MIKMKCKYCEKEIEGYTEKQVLWLIRTHITSRHPEKIIEFQTILDKTKEQTK